MTINGSPGADVERVTSVPDGVAVGGSTAHVTLVSPDRALDTLRVSGLGGGDRLAVAPGPGPPVNLRLDGGDGDDTIDGGDAGEVLVGGTGDDAVTGGGDDDTAMLGDGADSFFWNPGAAATPSEARAAPIRWSSPARTRGSTSTSPTPTATSASSATPMG